MTDDSLCLADLPVVDTPMAKPGIKREVEQTGEKKAKARSLTAGVIPCKLDMSKHASPKQSGGTAMPVAPMAASPVRPPCISAPALPANGAATQWAIERARQLMQARAKAMPMQPPQRAVAVKTPSPSAVTYSNGCMTMVPAPLQPLPLSPVSVASPSATLATPPAKAASPSSTSVPTATKAPPETKPKAPSADAAAGPCGAGSLKNSKGQKEHATPEMMASMQKQVQACAVLPGTVPCPTFDVHVHLYAICLCRCVYIVHVYS